MANVSLSIAEFKKTLQIASVTTIIIGSIVGMIRHFVFEADSTASLVAGLISGVTWAIFISIWAFRRPWTIKLLSRLTGKPIIHGVWFGKLTTNYGASEDNMSTDIPIAFVIRQTYLGYSLLSYTKNQDSQTLIEALEVDDQHEIIHLRYIYQFKIWKHDERKLTIGAAELRLIKNGTLLRGHYLTNSPTQGSAELRFVQYDCRGIDTFTAAEKLYQIKFPQ